MKQDGRGKIVALEGRRHLIPLNSNGDPAFTKLGLDPQETEGVSPDEDCVLAIFSPEEVVELVNRALYQQEYQRNHHRKRAALERERLKPVQDKVKQLFGLTSWMKCTEEQWQEAIDAVKREQQPANGQPPDGDAAG